ncbi:hypothetical protein [Lactococcus garvieae]|uniref:Uncharacterized protein n=1 Tax=Lactococcus garvieae TaxID=1363 RepID=A0AA46TVZ4_9LACT|nr:hypothetical protein [Lactococcus garvieae]UYT10412.1 hypothetical protein OF801_00290 [Lactococcus garvieae]UYT12453.1 hypothetical protein OF800_00295 [Lactococcus garvieae]
MIIPEKKKRRHLRNIALLVLLLLVVVGTYAFQAFNPRAINDRENRQDIGTGGRVHDYYNRDTENKDVFVENYGDRPIMARIRLSEFLETKSDGEAAFTPLVPGTVRENVESWTTWIPTADNINVRANVNGSNAFNRYSTLTLGWSRPEQDAPWYMPSFNHDSDDLRTAAAGHARDWIEGDGATDGVTDGTTHPGDGTDAYWSSGDTFDNSAGIWPDQEIVQEVAQNLPQGRPPMTIEQWDELEDYQKIGDFWVIDHQTGWAYWASLIEAGNATSYLLDAAEMTSAIDETVSNGYYYYGIHVDSQLISPRHSDDFLEGGDERLADFLTGIKNNSMNDAGSTNPRFELDSPPSAFNFDTMLPGRIFTMDGVRYRYLEQQGPHHLIIRNNPLTNTSFTNQNAILTSFYNGLTPEVQAIVAPVSIPTNVPGISDAQAAPWTGEGERWLPGGLINFPAAAGDETSVNPSGNPQAFALSLADVVRLSTPEGAFPNHAARISTHNRWWWTRTPGASGTAWHVGRHGLDGQLSGWGSGALANIGGGVRPALLVNNPN